MVDVSQWGVERIMQLPDHAFGRRSVIFTRQFVGTSAVVFWMVRNDLPERFVLWRIGMSGFVDNPMKSGYRFSLGSEDPADEAAFVSNEPLFRGDFDDVARKSRIIVPQQFVRVVTMRMPFESMGRRFICAIHNEGSSNSVVG